MTAADITRVRAIVTGVVQGVGFRYFATQLARDYGISGWVRNREDGAVELEAEGEEIVVKAFIKDLRIGPRGASVSGVDVEPLEPTLEKGNFAVRF